MNHGSGHETILAALYNAADSLHHRLGRDDRLVAGVARSTFVDPQDSRRSLGGERGHPFVLHVARTVDVRERAEYGPGGERPGPDTGQPAGRPRETQRRAALLGPPEGTHQLPGAASATRPWLGGPSGLTSSL